VRVSVVIGIAHQWRHHRKTWHRATGGHGIWRASKNNISIASRASPSRSIINNMKTIDAHRRRIGSIIDDKKKNISGESSATSSASIENGRHQRRKRGVNRT